MADDLWRPRTSPARRRAPGRFGSLRWRLAAWVAFVVVLASAITFVVVYRGTGDQLRAQIDHDLSGDSTELLATLRVALGQGQAANGAGQVAHGAGQVAHGAGQVAHGAGQVAHGAGQAANGAGQVAHGAERAANGEATRVAAAAQRYIASQPFSSTSAILFVHVQGHRTISNAPELFATEPTPDEGETRGEQTAENRIAGELLNVPAGYSILRSPDAGELRVLRRTLLSSRRVRVEAGVAEPLSSVARAQRGVAKAFILAAALALVVALLGALLIGSRFSRPLRRMAAVARRVDAGELSPRIRDPGPDVEARALADSFNHMLDRLTEAFAGQRAFVADASHELRTPLTVIQGQLEVLAAQSEPSAEEVRRVERLVRSEVARMTRLVDDLLLLARAEQAEFLRVQPIALRDFLTDLWDGVSLTAERQLELGDVPDGTLNADPDRLAQALRNLIENAIEHTAAPSGLVRLYARQERDGSTTTGSPRATSSVVFLVEDDGPGIPDDELDRVFDRFHRIDPARSRSSGGAGLGLSIVQAIAQAHRGHVRARRAPAGGALIELRISGFQPSGRRPAAAPELQAEPRQVAR